MYANLKVSAVLALLLTVSSNSKNLRLRRPVSSSTTISADKNWSFEKAPSWTEEFNYNGLPSSQKWGYDLGNSGWGNNEQQNYTNSLANASVADGKLTILAIKEESNGMKYSSARLVTKNKLDVLYGRIEVKAMLPSGKGTWPAIWMLPTESKYGQWPKSGEIDIMEHVGYDQNTVHFTTHTEAYYFKINTQKTSTKVINTASTAFHKYRVDWTPFAISGFYDDHKIFEFINEKAGYKVWPFDQRFHMLLNIAVGGDWGGAKGIDDSIFPQKMVVDYVRYYKMIDK
jgi:beta-glucanase (GH16 family)